MSIELDQIRLKALQAKTFNEQAISVQDDIIALANQIDSGQQPQSGVYDCLPVWSNTGIVTGWNLASLPAGFPDNGSADLNAYDASCNSSPDGTIVAIGDSICQRNTFSNISGVLNLGYSGEAMRRLMYRLCTHPAHREIMRRAGAVLFMSGVNDIGYYFDNSPPEVGPSGAHNAYQMVDYYYRDLAACMGGKWVVMGVLPINEAQAATNTGLDYTGYNSDITEMNARIKSALQNYATNADWVFIDPPVDMPDLFDTNGNLKAEHDDADDSIHPNQNCYDTIINPAWLSGLQALGVL